MTAGDSITARKALAQTSNGCRTYGDEQASRQAKVKRSGEAQIAFHQGGDDTEHKEQDSR
jgi:hypothetical protein